MKQQELDSKIIEFEQRFAEVNYGTRTAFSFQSNRERKFNYFQFVWKIDAEHSLKSYIGQLEDLAGMIGGSDFKDLVLEWRVRPEIGNGGRIYARFAIARKKDYPSAEHCAEILARLAKAKEDKIDAFDLPPENKLGQ